jgi:hypothetical protein
MSSKLYTPIQWHRNNWRGSIASVIVELEGVEGELRGQTIPTVPMYMFTYHKLHASYPGLKPAHISRRTNIVVPLAYFYL